MKKSSLKSGTSTESPDALPRGIGRPATRALAVIGVTRLSQLTKMTEEEVLSLHGVGPKAVGILREELQKSGRAFRDGNASTKSRAKTGVKKTSSKPQKYVQHHKDGSVWAQGQTINAIPAGYWEWFRRDGTRVRSGTFEKGEQVGSWTTYDKTGRVHKVTEIKPKK